MTSENFEYTTYNTVQKFRDSNTLMFLKYLCLTKQHLFKQNTVNNGNVKKYYKNFKQVFNIFKNVIYSCDGKAEYSTLLSLQCHMILQKSF